MVVIPANPDPSLYQEAETAFLREVGNCVTQWAFIDRHIFRLFKISSKTDTIQAAAIYYKSKTLSQRIELADELLRYAIPPEQYRGEWKRLRHLLVDDLIPTRNIIVHSPARRIGSSDGTKPIYIYDLYIESYEQVLNKTHKGLKGKTSIGQADLERHVLETREVEAQLKAFVDLIR
jgi:hypothetical protein